MNNSYRDLSRPYGDVNAGFQFEFFCAACDRNWKSPFKPYRRGRLLGLISSLEYIFSSLRYTERVTRRAADAGAGPARQEALEDAQIRAAAYFQVCDSCKKGYCADCFDEGAGNCKHCALQGGNAGGNSGSAASGSTQAGGLACPNCGTGNNGGRFCAECGFDMASTHKSCPSCGCMALRQARFCADCGHSF